MHTEEPAFPPLVPVARFQTEEEVTAFCAIAAECGVSCRQVVSPRTTTGFDATLGGTTHVMAYSLFVKEEDVAALRQHLESELEIDPLDPLNAAGRTDLLAMTKSPLEGNLCEQVVAAKILASRPPEETPGVVPPPDVDPYLAVDYRTARWLGVTGMCFTIAYVFILLNGIRISAAPDPEYAWHSRSGGIQGFIANSHDPVASNLRPFLITLIPMGTGGALFLSRRQLRSGSVRPMFPPFWRLIGLMLFWVPLIVLGILLGVTAG